MTFPVFSRLRLAPTEALKSLAIEGWLDEPGQYRRSRICESFREAGARDWVGQIVRRWGLDNHSVADLSEQLGVSLSAVSNLRNHSSTSIGVLAQWAASQNVPFPHPDHNRWSLHGINVAIPTATYLDQIGEEKPKSKSNKTPLPVLSEQEFCLLFVLEAGRLQDHWDSLTNRYEMDLYKAADDNAFQQFLQRFTDGFLRLTQIHSTAKSRYPIYFPRGTLTEDSRWQLCRDIDEVIRKRIWDGSRMWAAVNGLTPWLYGLLHDEDEEAA